MKKGREKISPKKPKTGQKRAKGTPNKGPKKGTPKKGPGEPNFLGEGGACSGTFFFCGGEGPKTKGPKEGPTTPPPPFIIIKGQKKPPPPQKKWKKLKQGHQPPPLPPQKKGKKGPRTRKGPPKKTRKGQKKEGSKARRAREAANPTGETRKSTLPLHNRLHNFN